jgi:hypothetical protein
LWVVTSPVLQAETVSATPTTRMKVAGCLDMGSILWAGLPSPAPLCQGPRCRAPRPRSPRCCSSA